MFYLLWKPKYPSLHVNKFKYMMKFEMVEEMSQEKALFYF